MCCNVACAMAGTREMIEEFCKDYGVDEGEVTDDKRFTFRASSALAPRQSADDARNETYHEGLTMDSAKKILRELK